MYLSGRIADFQGILMAAEDLRADAIHFISPNIIFVLAQNKQDYFYVKSTITVGQSVLVPKSSYRNMHLYLKGAKKGFSKPDSPFYLEALETVRFSSHQVAFNESDRLAMDVDIPALPLKKDVEFRMSETIQTSYDLQTPYLRLTHPNYKKLNQEMKKYKKRYAGKFQKSSDNAIRIEGEQLVLQSRHDDQHVRIETDIREFAVNQDYREISYPFSDRAFYLFMWLIRMSPAEEVIFLPRKDYCVIEGYLSNMVVKVRTMLKNDLYSKKEL